MCLRNALKHRAYVLQSHSLSCDACIVQYTEAERQTRTNFAGTDVNHQSAELAYRIHAQHRRVRYEQSRDVELLE